MDLQKILQTAVDTHVSDVFLVAGRPVSFRKHNEVICYGEEELHPEDTEKLLRQIYDMTPYRGRYSRLQEKGDDDFSFSIQGLSRFRISAYRQRGSASAVIRVIPFTLPDPQERGLPDELISLGDHSKGMILVTGPAGSGKSTSLACIIDHINETRANHIITLEDPIEFLHRHKKSLVSQREIHLDSESYISALRAALRQSPDVILLGEMRDYETISVAVTAAETGHLLFSTLHTLGAANTINRIIDVFPANQQRQIAIQLSSVLNAVVSQQLIPSVDGRLVPAFEIMNVTPARRNLIRDNKVHQIDGIIYSSGKDMRSMDSSLLELYQNGKITEKTALAYAANPDALAKKL